MSEMQIWERIFQFLKNRDEQCFRMYQSDFNYMATIGGLLVSMRGQGKPDSIDECVWHEIIDNQYELVKEEQKRIAREEVGHENLQYREGWNAWGRHYIDECPYDEDSAEYDAWMDGYNDHEIKKLLDDPK